MTPHDPLPHPAGYPAGSVLLRVEGLAKRYASGVQANAGVSLQVAHQQVHAVVGENGAGKSTLMKMLYGLEQPDEGSIFLDGRACRFRSPRDAIAAGVGLVPQHLELVPSLTVAENVVLGAEPRTGPLLDTRRACALTDMLARAHGLAVDPRARVAGLPAGVQQRVAILKALHRGARLLLLDEPSTLLTPQETEDLFGSLRQLLEGGLSVVLITHRLAEVQQASDAFTVMRAGRVVGSGASREVSRQRLAELIVGSVPPVPRVRRIDARGMQPRMQVRGLHLLRARSRPALAGLSLDVAAGEILGIAGVEGNGQDALSDVLGGRLAPSTGSVHVNGQPLAAGGVRAVRAQGVGSVPEDRLHGGVAPALSIAENLAALDYFRAPASRYGWLDRRFIAARARELMQRFRVSTADEQLPVGALSGGNMQKVVLARELSAAPRFLLVSQPTRGVDVGAAAALHDELVALRDGGAALLLISADLDEVFALSDRIAVLFQGRIVAHFRGGHVAQRTVGAYMTGLQADPAAAAMLDSPFTAATDPAAAPAAEPTP
jgi:ABC-type uncharacterized transport system ATPase subunit